MEKLLSEAIVEELSCEESNHIIGGYATTATASMNSTPAAEVGQGDPRNDISI